MEHLRNPQPYHHGSVPFAAPGPAPDPMISLAGLDQALRSVLQRKYPASEAHGERSRWTERDVSTAIDLVQDAGALMRSTEDHARVLALRAAEELEAAEERIRSAEARAKAAEMRAQEAEARAKEHEQWFVEIHNVILGTFPLRQAERMLDAASRG